MSAKLDAAYEVIVNEIVEAFETTGEWKPSWNQLAVLPHNATTGRRYQGGNVIVLWASQVRNKFSAPMWATYPQWSNVGGQVNKGQHGTPIIFWTKREIDTDHEERHDRTILRTFTVFNIDQVSGPVDLEALNDVAALPAGAESLTKVPATVLVGRPCYVPSLDVVQCPLARDFDSIEDWAATLAHELGHWTGHASRLDREISSRWKADAYAYEELVAELSAAFTCASIGVHSTKSRADHAGYIRHWIEGLRDDPSVLMNAATAAQLATNYLLAYAQPEQATTEAA